MTAWLILAFTAGCIAGYAWHWAIRHIIAEHERRTSEARIAGFMQMVERIGGRNPAGRTLELVPRGTSDSGAPDGPRAA